MGAQSCRIHCINVGCRTASKENLESLLRSGWRSPHCSGIVKSSSNVLLNTLGDGRLSGHNRPSATEVLTCCGLIRRWICDHASTPYKHCMETILAWIASVQYAKLCEDQIKAKNIVSEVAKSVLDTYERYVALPTALHGCEWWLAKPHWDLLPSYIPRTDTTKKTTRTI